MKSTSPRRITLLVTVVGSAIAVLIAWGTASVRDDVGVANVGLLLAIVCVAAALSDWFAGSVTSLFAALSLNFFHTEPVHSLRIDQTEEAASVTTLHRSVGVLAGERLRVTAAQPGRAIPTTFSHLMARTRTTAPVWGESIISPPPMYMPTWLMGL